MENISNQQNNGQGFGIASLVIGILALLFSIIPCVGTSAILIGIVAVVFGVVSLTKASNYDAPKGMSITGISLGGLAVIIAIFWLVLIVGIKNSNITDKFEDFESLIEWAESFENIDVDIENELEELESLDNLEKTLDEMEGVIEDDNNDIHDTINEAKDDVKKIIGDSQEE